MFYPDQPKSQGVANGLKRAAQMTGFEWNPLKNIPSVHFYLNAQQERTYADTYLQAGLPQKGVIYSSARLPDKHVGFEVLLETYATALKNPDSILYTRSLHGTSGHGAGCWYGIVCSAFASYVHDFPRQVVCSEWPTYPGVSQVEIEKKEDLEKLELLDLVLNPKRHIAVVTGILRDVDGKVQKVEVSESTLPVCRRLWYSPEEFERYWLNKEFRIYRDANVDSISYTPNPYSKVPGDEKLIDESNFLDFQAARRPRAFMSDYGNKANYALGEPVVFSVFDEAVREIEVMDQNENTETLQVENGKASYLPKTAGLYHAYGVNAEGLEEEVEWYVFDFKTALDKKVYKVGEPITVCFQDAENQENCFRYYLKGETHYKKYAAPISKEEIKAGKFVCPGAKEPGRYYISVYTVGPYCNYGSLEIPVTVE